MSTNVTLNGSTYAIPAVGDSNWGTVLANFFIAIASSTLQKTGGTFTLTAETDFGATYGLKSAYYKTRATNPSSTGNFRLGNAEYIGWRNAANSADYLFGVNGSNQLIFNSVAILTANETGVPVVTGTSASPSAIVAGTGVAFSSSKYFNTWFIQGSGGAVTVSANPQIAAGVVGQRLTLIGRSDTNTVTFSDGTGLVLQGPCVLGANQILGLFCDGTNWLEEFRSV